MPPLWKRVGQQGTGDSVVEFSPATRKALVRFFFKYGFSYLMQRKYLKDRYTLNDIIIQNVVCDNPGINYNFFATNQRVWDEC